MNTPTWMNVARLYKLNGAQGAWIGIQNTCSGRADGITGYFLIDVSPQFGWLCFFSQYPLERPKLGQSRF